MCNQSDFGRGVYGQIVVQYGMHESIHVRKSVEPEPTKSEALARMAAIEQQIYQTGAVDTEPSTLESIRKALLAETIEPSEALRQAEKVLAGRQDYH